MRIRSIKPEFWESDDVAALALEDRLLFIGLWSYVDDDGTGLDKLNRITADLFAGDLEREPRETFARVSRGLQHLFAAGLIVRYTVENKDYLAITNWKKHQRVDRPNKSRHPAPTSANAVIRDTLATPSRHPRETPASGTGEQGNRGTGEQGVPHAPVIVTREHDEREQEIANPPALVYDDGTPTPAGVVREWELASGSPLTDSTRAAMRLSVAQCLKAGHDPQTIARGLADWAGSPITATSQIPGFVDRAAVRPRLAPVPAKQHNADAWLELGRQMAEEGR